MLIYISEEDAKAFVGFADKDGAAMSKPVKKLADAIREQL